ncbi:MAG: phospho-N-acetylmuramoyl-pentapeptide-transferase [Planctomycetes bacterium]|nr:phospho-N-acetylmuramoyl-pentapeptide-transferase [Planctomycetota bacterium]
MIYALAEWLHSVPGARLFQYISFRVALAAAVAFGLSMLMGPVVIRKLKSLGFQDREKNDDASLAKLWRQTDKRNTPTMGGIFLVPSFLISTLLFAKLSNIFIIVSVCLVIFYMGIGFLDDFAKLTNRAGGGLKRREKLLWQSVGALVAVAVLFWFAKESSRPSLLKIYPPFFNEFAIDLPSLGFVGSAIFTLFEWFTITGTGNAVNFTDGLDGLAAGCALIAAIALGALCYVAGHVEFAQYLRVPAIQGAGEMCILAGAVVGACLGFLWFNCHPAQVFMGDTGSLPLGAVLGSLAVVARQELVLPVVAGVFVAEGASSWIQIYYSKFTGGKRFFTKAPIHHIWQLRGYPESKIVVRFWIVAALLAICGVALLKIR